MNFEKCPHRVKIILENTKASLYGLKNSTRIAQVFLAAVNLQNMRRAIKQCTYYVSLKV